MKWLKAPERTAEIHQGGIVNDYDDREELHVIPRPEGVGVSVWDLRCQGYTPEAGIFIEWEKLDEVIAALQAAKAHHHDHRLNTCAMEIGVPEEDGK